MPTTALVIGGMNQDCVGLPQASLVWHDSNPGIIKTSAGGVGRNIAENLARLGVETKLLSLVGADAAGDELLAATARAGVDISAVARLTDQRTSTYFSLMNGNDMAVAIADMGIMDLLSPQRVEALAAYIEAATLVVVDTNIPAETVAFLLTTFTSTRFLIDPVSVTKAQKIAPLLAHIDTLKPNRLEAEYLTGIRIKTLDDAKRATAKLIDQGVTHVFLSLGEQGTLYGNAQQQAYYPALPVQVKNATGAGDSMVAGIAYGILNDLSARDILHFASAAAALTLTAETTIAPNFSVEAVRAWPDLKSLH